MRKKLIMLILAVTLPILFSLSWFMANRAFTLSLEQEKQRTQMTESIVFRDVRERMKGLDFDKATAYAGQYRDYYRNQGIELVFCWNGSPLAGAVLPDPGYESLLQGQRSAMLDTLGSPHRYVVAEQVDNRLIMILMRDISDLYLLKDQYLTLAFGAAAAASVLLTLLTLLFARMLIRPVRQLTEAAQVLTERTGQSIPLPVARRDEIGTLSRAFADMQAAVEDRESRLREESEKRQALLDALAHEMRTPLTSLLGNARLMQQDLPAEERNAVADSMVKEIRRLTDMDRQLMKLSDLRQEVLEPEPVSILEILNDTAARMQEQAAGISMLVRGKDSIIPGDRELLSLLCDNLCANAIHASQPGMTVSLVAEPEGFSVEDEGTGMTQETLLHACEPFWKADKARTRRHGGAGLGLSLCRRIAELHRGRLSFDSSPGKGTRVTFTTSLQLPDDSITSSMA